MDITYKESIYFQLTNALDYQSENDVTIALVKDLEAIGLLCKTEVRIPKRMMPKGSRGCRFDVVAYRDGKPVGVIEVKRNGARCKRKRRAKPKQVERYQEVLDIPVFLCKGHSGITSIIQALTVL